MTRHLSSSSARERADPAQRSPHSRSSKRASAEHATCATFIVFFCSCFYLINECEWWLRAESAGGQCAGMLDRAACPDALPRALPDESTLCAQFERGLAWQEFSIEILCSMDVKRSTCAQGAYRSARVQNERVLGIRRCRCNDQLQGCACCHWQGAHMEAQTPEVAHPPNRFLHHGTTRRFSLCRRVGLWRTPVDTIARHQLNRHVSPIELQACQVASRTRAWAPCEQAVSALDHAAASARRLQKHSFVVAVRVPIRWRLPCRRRLQPDISAAAISAAAIAACGCADNAPSSAR